MNALNAGLFSQVINQNDENSISLKQLKQKKKLVTIVFPRKEIKPKRIKLQSFRFTLNVGANKDVKNINHQI